MKKKILSLAVIVICLATLASGTIAYFTSEDRATNIITSGDGINIEIIEKTRGEGGVLVDFPKGGISGVMPGSSISKIVSVENRGGSEAWIRIKVGQSIVDKTGKPLPLTLGANESVMSFYVDESKWTLWDGWYYCRQPVGLNESTEILFENVHFTKKMGNDYQNCTAFIEIYAQAVQTANNGDHVMEAEGWPSEVVD